MELTLEQGLSHSPILLEKERLHFLCLNYQSNLLLLINDLEQEIWPVGLSPLCSFIKEVKTKPFDSIPSLA